MEKDIQPPFQPKRQPVQPQPEPARLIRPLAEKPRVSVHRGLGLDLGQSWESRELIRLGQDLGWASQVIGYAPPPEAPVRLGDWMITPAHLDSSPLPPRAAQRIQVIHANGLRPRYVLVHETPKLLAAPEPKQKMTWSDIRDRLDEAWAGTTQSARAFGEKAAPVAAAAGRAAGRVAGQLAPLAMQATKALAVTAAVTAGAVAAVSVAGMAVLMGLVVAAAAADPVLIAITEEDNCWIEVDRWDTA